MKQVFCKQCKYYGKFIYSHQHPGCYHYKNVRIVIKPEEIDLNPGWIEGGLNKNNDCTNFKRGFNFIVTQFAARNIIKKLKKENIEIKFLEGI